VVHAAFGLAGQGKIEVPA